MNPQAKRLYEAARALKGITGQSELARALNTSPQTVKNWETRGVSKQGMLAAEHALGCSALWIESGHGEMTSQSVPAKSADSPTINQESRTPLPRTLRIDLMNPSAFDADDMIFLDWDEPVQAIEFSRLAAVSLLRTRRPDNLRLVNAAGDTMQPTINPGDLLFVDVRCCSCDQDGIYVFIFDGKSHIKRLQWRGDRLAVKADNTTYDPWEIGTDKMDKLRILGRVVSILPVNIRSLA